MSARIQAMVPIMTDRILKMMGSMSMKDLAKFTGYNEKTVARWFKTQEMSIEGVFLCAWALSCEPGYFAKFGVYKDRLRSLRPVKAYNSSERRKRVQSKD